MTPFDKLLKGTKFLSYTNRPLFDMINIGKTWDDFVQQALNQGYSLSNQCREGYKKWVSHESEENITELQMGTVVKKNI
jgi:hypothetical protein